ncbi:MAG TPA: hypothetical protein VFJ16_21570 [Longimicrobium sp.]|nr:hypothetical protein [Longimicrobium sp.]
MPGLLDATPALLDARAVHARWSKVNCEYLDYVERTPACLQRSSYPNLYRDPSLRVFSIQPWPFFVDSARYREVGEVAVGMDRLLRSVIERFLRNDPREVARFYGSNDDRPPEAPEVNEALVMVVAEEPSGVAGAPARADYVETARGLRMVEYNAGGTLGGLQTDAVAGQYLASPLTARFLSEQNLRVRPPQILQLLFLHLVEDTVRMGAWTEGELNVAVVVRPAEPPRVAVHSVDAYNRHLRAALRACGVQGGGRVFLCDADDLVLDGNWIRLHGHRVHAVIEQHDGSADLRATFRAFKMGGVNLYSGPIAWLINDKRNLVLISEHADSDEFTAAERALIEAHLPWTRRALPQRTTFRRRPFRIPEDLVEHREEMVLKKASSVGGRQVVVGRFLADAQWERAIARALSEEDWVVQEYEEGLPFCFQSEAGVVRHDMIWGLFTFGGRFGGAYLRLAPVGRAGGRVNGCQGADVGAALEVIG